MRNLSRQIGVFLGAWILLMLAACGSQPLSLTELNTSYEDALLQTSPLAATIHPGSDLERLAFDKLQRYFTRMTTASVRAQTSMVYASDAYLNDTLTAVHGVRPIEDYFVESTERATVLNVEFLDRVPAGIDWFVRWRMTVQADGLNKGEPVLSYGVTQFRFDPQGRVLVHKDFWDAASGLYEQLPGIGGIVRGVRAKIAGSGDRIVDGEVGPQ